MPKFRATQRLLVAMCALSLSACTAGGSPPTGSAPAGETPAGPTVTPSAAASGPASTASNADLTVNVRADASLRAFSTAQQSPFSLCLGQIATADTRLMLPAQLPDAALNALAASGATIERADGQATATIRQAVTLAQLLAGIDFRLRGVPGGTLEGRTSFFNAAGTELGFVAWRLAPAETGKRVAILLSATADTAAGDSCPRIGASVSGAEFQGAGGQLVSSQPLPGPSASPAPTASPSPVAGQAPGAPLNPRLVEQTTGSLTLQWDLPADARSFNLYLDGAQVASGHTFPNYYHFDALRPSTTYRLGVQSVNAAGSSEILTVTAATTASGRSASGNFSSGGSSGGSRPRSSPSPSPTATPWPEFSAGPAVHVNTSFVTGGQEYPQIAMDADGDYVMVWADYGRDYEIYAQRFDSGGSPVGSEIHVNQVTDGIQFDPSVAMADDGSFVVVWDSDESSEVNTIKGRRFVGDVGGTEFFVSATTTSGDRPDIAMAPDGHFVVAWDKFQNFNDVFARVFDVNAEPIASEFQVNLVTEFNQRHGNVAIDDDGDFVIAWQGIYTGNEPGSGIAFRRYAPDGSPKDLVEVPVTLNQGPEQYSAEPVMDSDGDFVITWLSSSFGDDPSYASVAQRYNSAGERQGSEFLVNTFVTDSQELPQPALAEDGSFIVAWASNTQDGQGWGIYLRRFDDENNPLTEEFMVNQYTSGTQYFPGIAMAGNGDFVTVWHGNGPEDDDGIYFRQFRYPGDSD